jgi:hypothetical protein
MSFEAEQQQKLSITVVDLSNISCHGLTRTYCMISMTNQILQYDKPLKPQNTCNEK